MNKIVFSNSPFEHATTASPVDNVTSKSSESGIINNGNNKNKVSSTFRTLLKNPSGSQEELRQVSIQNSLSKRPPATPFAMKLAENGSRRNVVVCFNIICC